MQGIRGALRRACHNGIPLQGNAVMAGTAQCAANSLHHHEERRVTSYELHNEEQQRNAPQRDLGHLCIQEKSALFPQQLRHRIQNNIERQARQRPK